MGAWSQQSFGNDDACDWIADLVVSSDLAIIEQALNLVVDSSDDYLEAPQASIAIAAAEVVARLQGNWGPVDTYTERVDDWVLRTRLRPPADLARKAHQAILRIVGEDSELRQLWEDSDDGSKWVEAVDDLQSRIRD